MLRKLFGGISSLLGIGQAEVDRIIDAVEIPQELLDPIEYSLLVDPVVTPSGHCYSRASILKQLQVRQIDPMAGHQPLTFDQLRPAPPEITRILEQIPRQRKATRNALLTAEANVVGILKQYQQFLDDLGKQMEAVLQNLVLQGNIQQIKNRLKIDINNPAHLAYWQGKGSWGREMPNHIHQMMRVAALRHESVEDFIRAIERARQLSLWHRFFNYLLADAQTNNITSTNDLRNLTIR